MTSQPGYQTIVIHILLNISKNKGNQTMKIGQLIKCNANTQNVVEKLLPDPFRKS